MRCSAAISAGWRVRRAAYVAGAGLDAVFFGRLTNRVAQAAVLH
jgi:hypothetical protein